MNFIAKKKRISAKNFYLKIQFLIVVLAFIFFTNPAYSAFNEQINYQGKLTDSSNQAVSDGSYNMEFKLYDASSGGTLLWTETCTSTNKITIDNGLFSHLLGSVNVLPDDIFNQNVWLSVNIGSTTTEPVWDGEMSPRKKLGSVPSSFESKRLSGKLESEFADISETENISGLWTFSATTTLATTTIASSTITALNAVSLNVNGTSSTLWDQAYHYFNASSTNLNTTHFIVNASSSNWDWTHDYVFASSTNWDAAYHWGDHSLAGYLTTVDISANTNLTVTATGLQLSGDSIALSAGYNIPTNASTTAWNSSTYATEQGSGKWNSAYSQAHATATENITGIDLTGQLFSLTDGYIIPLSASTTNWNNFYDTPSGRITAGDHIDWSGNTLNVLDDWWNALSDMTLTQGYVYVGDSSNNPIATSTLFISGQKVGIATTTMTGALSIEGGAYLGPTSTAPATANGMMYYNVTENKFKCYQNSAWVDCITAASVIDGSGTSTQIAYWSDSNTLTSTSSFAWDNTNGRLGVGTSTPQDSLHLYNSSLLIDSPVNPTLAGTYNIAETTFNVYVSGKYAYVGIGNGIKIVDISQPTNPVLEGTYGAAAAVQDIYVSGKYAYAAVTGSGLDIVDISNPNSPVLVGNYNTAGSAAAVYVSGKYAYVADNTNGLLVIDISNPGTPILVGNFLHTDNAAVDVYVSGKYAYVANSTGLLIIDISNPKSPVLTGSTDALITCTAYGVYAAGKYAYITCGFDGLRRIDISNPASPALDGNYDTVGASQGVYVSGKYAYVAANASGLVILDISNSGNPILISSDVGFDSTRGVFVSGKYAYIVGNDAGTGLQIIDIQGADINALTAGNISTNDLTVSENVDIGNNLYVRSGLNVGISGIFSDGPLSIATTSYFGGDMGIGTSTPVSGISLTIENGLLLGSTTTAPTAKNGAMYYNATENKFKCYQNSAWVDCITASSVIDGSGTSTQIAYWSDSNTLTSTSSFAWDNTNGRLGVGTSTPSTTFQVYGTSTLRDIVPDASLTYNLGASTTRWNNAWISNIYLGTSTWVISQAKDGRVQFLNSAENGKEIFTIALNGNVGVGTSTPASNFSIDGGLLLAPTTTVPLAVNGSMYYDSTDGKFKCYQAGAWTNCIGTGGTGEPAGSDSYVQYNNSGSFGGEKTFVWDDTNDRMGIGTSTPTSSLEIFSSTTNPILTISSGENASSYDPRIRLSAGSGMPVAKFNIGYDYSDDMFRIVAGDTITANKGLEISPLLEVGIGTSSRATYSLNTIDAYFEGDTNFDGLGTFNNGLNITGLLSVTGLLLVTGDIGYSGTIIDINPDLAEKFPTKDKTIEPGDVVASDVFNKEHVIKTDKEYQLNAMGVVSTKPGIILGGLIDGGGVNVALAGRIPVKINLNNGEIKAGDYLTSSDIPGIAMKATKAGKVLGIALEDFSQSDFDNGKDRITMFVDPQFIGNDLVIASDSTGQITTQYQLTLQDIQNQLSSIGIILNQDGYFEAKTIKAKKMITEQIELIDKTTQELHCIWYENGVRHEEIGACSDVLQESTGSNIPSQASDSAGANSTASQTTSTQESNSATSSVVSQLPFESNASSSNSTSESLPPEPESQPVKNPESIVSEPVALPEEPVLESQALPSQ